MTSNQYMEKFVNESQNFILRLSEDSTEGTSIDTDVNNILNNKNEQNDVIVISDSSSTSPSNYTNRSRKTSTSSASRNNRREKTKCQRLYILETSSSEDEKENFNLPWRMNVKSDNNFLNKDYINRNAIHVNEISYTSDETTSINDAVYDNGTKDHNTKFDTQKFYKTSTMEQTKEADTNAIKDYEKYNIKQTHQTIISNCASDNTPNIGVNKTCRNTPTQQCSSGKTKLTKKDAHKILKTLRSTKVIYSSPKKNNVIIDETIDTDDDVIHPAISPKKSKEMKHHDDNSDIINTSLQNDIIPESQIDSSKLSNNSREEILHKPLSERKKIQIAEWLMTNASESISDSSCNIIPASSSSGYTSLERLEMDYETPNNRKKIAKTQGKSDRQYNVNVNCDKTIQPSSTGQTTPDRFIQKYKTNNSKFHTPDKSKFNQAQNTEKQTSSTVNTPKNMDVMGCADILDKLYGDSWRDKANALLPATEPRKESTHIKYRTIETERKPTLKNKQHIKEPDWRSKTNILLPASKPRKQSTHSKYGISQIERNLTLKNKHHTINPDLEKLNSEKIQRKQNKHLDSFIDDESLSGESNSESMYHTALTNLRTSSNSMIAPKPMSALTNRVLTICDTDTEDEDCKTNNDPKKNLRGRRLSFSDKESSDTSEFDPGDHILPKYTSKKKHAEQSSKITSKYKSITTYRSESFLASLSSMIHIRNAHPDAKKYRLNYKNNKEELCTVLYKLYNEKVFENRLPCDMLIEWNIRMRGSAGYCYNKKSVKSLNNIIKSSRIVLATKILDTPDRVRDTLIHEMCHAAAWIINDVCDGHGRYWTAWANKAMKTFPELPPIRRCHDYEIKTKFTYRCTSCGYSIGRHSKSLDTNKKRCGYCYGNFELLINKTTKSGVVQMLTPRKKEPCGFALYVKENYNSVKKERNIKHADVMKILGQQFSAIKITKKNEPESSI